MQPVMPGQMPPKKGMSTGMTLLIVFGVIALLFGGTCIGGYFFLKQKVKAIGDDIADGGLVLVSPPEVREALAGPKKDYVGSWSSQHGSTLVIAPDGNMKFDKTESSTTEKYDLPISGFHGDDILIKPLVSMTIHVTEAPHQVDGKWQMTADSVHLTR